MLRLRYREVEKLKKHMTTTKKTHFFTQKFTLQRISPRNQHEIAEYDCRPKIQTKGYLIDSDLIANIFDDVDLMDRLRL